MNVGILIAGILVTAIVLAAMGLLVWGLTLEARDRRAERDAGARESEPRRP